MTADLDDLDAYITHVAELRAEIERLQGHMRALADTSVARDVAGIFQGLWQGSERECEELRAAIAYVRQRSQHACEILNEFDNTGTTAFGDIPPRHGGMRRILLESPYAAGDIQANVVYARQCVRDAVLRGEAPIASHLLFTQPGILRDHVPDERKLGIEAGLAWLRQAEAMVLYTDRGISGGMADARDHAQRFGLPVEERSLSFY